MKKVTFSLFLGEHVRDERFEVTASRRFTVAQEVESFV